MWFCHILIPEVLGCIRPTDSCDGGFVQYYSGLDCTTYAGSSPLNAVVDSVASLKIADVAINCTTAAVAAWTLPPALPAVAAL